MRKLSELYQIILDEFFDLDPAGICGRINSAYKIKLMSIEERYFIYDHFQSGDHKFPSSNRIGFWWDNTHDRIEYLKYLIELTKSQNI